MLDIPYCSAVNESAPFFAASSLAGREILVTLPLTVLVYLPFRWVRRRIYSE